MFTSTPPQTPQQVSAPQQPPAPPSRPVQTTRPFTNQLTGECPQFPTLDQGIPQRNRGEVPLPSQNLQQRAHTENPYQTPRHGYSNIDISRLQAQQQTPNAASGGSVQPNFPENAYLPETLEGARERHILPPRQPGASDRS